MHIKKTITSRELLRNFKSCKEMLTLGKVECFIIPLENDQRMTISLEREHGTGKTIAEAIVRLPKPFSLKRPARLFEDIIRKQK